MSLALSRRLGRGPHPREQIFSTMDNNFLFTLFIFLVAVCSIVPILSRFRLGSIPGYVVVGALIGPSGIGVISNPEGVMHIAEIGIVMMLFLIGLELSPALLWRRRSLIFGLGFFQVSATALCLSVLGIALGYSPSMSIVCGLALSLSSTSVVLQLLKERGALATPHGQSSFSVLLFQDLAFIPILLILPFFAPGAGDQNILLQNHWTQGLSPIAQVGVVVGALIALFLAVHVFSRSLFHYIAQSNIREVFTASSLALIVGITLLMEHLGLSPALGAFLAGVILANSEYRPTIEVDIQPFKGLFLALFFISIGMGIELSFVVSYAGWLGLSLLGFMGVKALILLGLARFYNLRDSHSLLFACFLSQGGEFAFALFEYSRTLGIFSQDQKAFLIALVALSLSLSPLLVIFLEWFLAKQTSARATSIAYDEISHSQDGVIIAGYGRFGQVIGRFLKAQGVKPVILESDPQQVKALRQYGSSCYFGDASRVDLLNNAGASSAKIFVIAIGDADKCLDIVKVAKTHFPNLTIFARARNRRHAYELHKLGVNFFRRETFDSALTMAQDVMQAFGATAEETRLKASQFQEHDEKTLKDSFAIFDQERELIAFTRRASGELENILSQDHSGTGFHRAHAPEPQKKEEPGDEEEDKA